MEVLVVTGGIGSGKSEACRIIRDIYGCGVYSADDRVKDLYSECPALVKEIEDALNTHLRDTDGVFIPGRLAEIIFNDRNALETVESIVFPALLADFRIWTVEYANDPFVLFESATILEKKFFKGFGDKVLVIDAPFEMRLERACMRDSLDREKIFMRMRNQVLMNRISEGSIMPEVDAVICNDGSLQNLRQKLRLTIDRLIDINR